MLTDQIVDRIARRVRDDLKSPVPADREQALDRLGSLRGSHVEDIGAALADPDEEVRSSAAANLGRIRQERAWPLLVEAARTEASDDVLCGLVRALGSYSSPRILERLIGLLEQRERDHLVHMEIVVQLWKYDRPEATDALRAMVLTHDSDLVRVHAADSLSLHSELRRGDAWMDQFWAALVDDRAPAVASIARQALERKVEERVANVGEVVVRHLGRPEARERSHALHRLAMLDRKDALNRALPLLGDPEASVRMACCLCLGALRDEEAVRPILSLLAADRDGAVQTGALVSLEEYHSGEIAEYFLGVLETPDLAQGMQSLLYRQLWKYPSERTVACLRAGLSSSMPAQAVASAKESLRFLDRLGAW